MNIYLIAAITVFTLVNLAYILSRFLKRNDFMDILWGPGFLVIASVFMILIDVRIIYDWYLFVLTAVWAIRLSVHIFVKNTGKPEDFRYQNWREEWGQTEWWRSYLQIYLLQGFFMFIISMPIVQVLGSELYQRPLLGLIDGCFGRPPSSFLTPTIAIIIGGLVFESIADYQKSVFKKSSPKGLMKTGLWKYSRHPNYFGEAVYWWGIALFAMQFGYYILPLISALTITILLRFVSGVPMLEKAKEGNTAYDQYKKETPVFVPFLKP